MIKGQKSDFTTVFSTDIKGGLNLANNPVLLDDQEASRLLNLYYQPHNSKLANRPCLEVVTDTDIGDPITIIYPFVYVDTGVVYSKLICCAGNQLYELDTTDNTWDAITGATTSQDRPAMCSFNNKLYIADGAYGLKYYDGTSYNSSVCTAKPTAVTQIAGRLVINDQDDRDAVLFSEEYNAEAGTAWNYSTGDAVLLRAGYGDGATVVGFEVIMGKLLVFKRHYDPAEDITKYGAKKQTYIVDTSWDTSSWKCEVLTQQNGALDAFTAVSAGQACFYLDSEGFERLTSTNEYGDIAYSPVGGRINGYIKKFARRGQFQLAFLPSVGCVCILPSLDVDGASKNELFLYNTQLDNFVMWDMQTEINHVCEWNGDIYMAGNAHLYKLIDGDQDEIAPADLHQVYSVIRTKVWTIPFSSVLAKKVELSFEHVQEGQLECGAYKSDLSVKWSITDSGEWPIYNEGMQAELYDALGSLAVADYEMGATISNIYKKDMNLRDRGIAFQVRSTDGRYVFGRLNIFVQAVE